MKNYRNILIFFMLLCSLHECIAQSSGSGAIAVPNTPSTGAPNYDYLGWVSGTLAGATLAVPELTIKNEDNMPINFYTQSGPGALANMRMQIFEDPTNAANVFRGNVGIGDFSGTFPSSKLHVHNGPSGYTNVQFTNTATGIGSPILGFSVGIEPTGIADLVQYSNNLPIRFWAKDATGTTFLPLVERCQITSGNKMLNNDAALGVMFDGFRIWNPGYTSSNVYDPTEALDLWTAQDGITSVRYGRNGLVQGKHDWFEMHGRLNGLWFNAAALQSQPTFRAMYMFNVDSIEVARIGNKNNITRGFTRIGLQPSTPVDATRRFEVFDAANAPQVRITQDVDVVYTDFKTASDGNLYIDTKNGSLSRYVGIGDIPSFIAQSQLHQHWNDRKGDTWHQFTTTNTGATFQDGLKIGLHFVTSPLGDKDMAEFRQYEDTAMVFSTGDPGLGHYDERMRIDWGLGGDGHGGFNNTICTKVSINHHGFVSPPNMAYSMLNLGEPGPGQPAGQRKWMDVGTYDSFGSDNMYTGLKDENSTTNGTDRKDAIVNWGDNIDNGNPDKGPEALRFIFTAYPGFGGATGPYDFSDVNGLEVGRMTSQGNMGIGALFTNTLAPKRRLDIFDDGINHNLAHGNAWYRGGPQLRLTQTLATSVLGGIWTDFQTMGTTGDLQINNSGNGTTNYVGIANGTSALTRMLDVNGNGRFRTLPSANDNTLNKIVVVNSLGELFYRDVSSLPTGGGGVNVCGSPVVPLTNYVPRYTNTAGTVICESDIYDDYTNHKVGIGNAAPGFKLDVSGDLNLSVGSDVMRFQGYKVFGWGGSSTSTLVGTDAGGIDLGAIHHIPSGSDNTVIGSDAGFSLPCPTCLVMTSTNYNTFVGSTAGFSVTNSTSDEGSSNTFLGVGSGYYVSTGKNNSAVGFSSGGGNTSGAVLGVGGDDNTSIGYFALGAATTGKNNASVGFNTLLNNSTGSNNSAIGSSAGSNITTGSYNTFIGSGADATSVLSTYRTAMGAGTSVSVDNCIAIGRNGTDRIVVAGTAPTGAANALTVFGNTDISSGSIYMIGNAPWTWQAGTYNTFLGFQGTHAGITGSNNTTIGQAAGPVITTGSDNSFLGQNAGLVNTTGFYNTFLGSGSGNANTTGHNNIMIGLNAGDGQIDHNSNVFIGNLAGGPGTGSSFGANADEDTYVGFTCAQHLDGAYNTVMGANSFSNTGYSGDNNTFIGRSTSSLAANVDDCALLGNHSTLSPPSPATTISNATAIGSYSTVQCNDCMVLGTTGATYTPPGGGSVTINQVRVGIGYTNPTTTVTVDDFLLYVNSIPRCSTCTMGTGVNSAFFNGDIYVDGVYHPSDSTLKNNIQALQPNVATNIINQLNPKTYTFNQQNNPQLHLHSGVECGLMSQEVEQLLPALVKELTAPAILDSAGNVLNPELTFKSVNYTGIIPYLIQNAKEQNQKIDSLISVDSLLDARLTNLEGIVAGCCSSQRHSNPGGGDQGNSSMIDVELKNAKTIILNQNVPNPFAEQTTITYFITDDVKKAQIMFYDNKGTVLKIVDINEKGAGQINVYAADLSSGNYTYTLIADGKVIDTKKMIKTN